MMEDISSISVKALIFDLGGVVIDEESFKDIFGCWMT